MMTLRRFIAFPFAVIALALTALAIIAVVINNALVGGGD